MIKKISEIWDESIYALLISIFVTAFVGSLISDITDMIFLNSTKSFDIIEFHNILMDVFTHSEFR